MKILARFTERQKAWLLLGGVLLFAVFLFLYNSKTMHFVPRCPFFWATGLYCPGCGTTRGFHRLLHGDIIGALHANILMTITVPYILHRFLSYLSVHLLGKKIPEIMLPPLWVKILVGFTLVFWVVRNIPIYPFNQLIP
ncbi:MAG: DUF2752 domain-containing protein [Ignavibacteriae bacterium]|nr:DUF2752 domain-containing protein [Ignavibacteriota bacterium]